MKKPKKQYATISYKYYCKKCSHFLSYILDFDERLNEFACPKCLEKLKYCGGNDIRVSATGNCGYISLERQSERNIKEIGQDRYNQMCEKDPIISKRIEAKKEENRPWWRKYQDDPSKPINLKDIKNPEKYIETGEKG